MSMDSRVSAGDLPHRIQIVDLAGRQDTAGGTTSSPTPFGPPVWAKVTALAGRELYSAQQVNAQITHRITIRWMKGVKSNQNVIFNDRTFQIVAVLNPDERTVVLSLLCLEREDRTGLGTHAET